jgi:hypothetical protein
MGVLTIKSVAAASALQRFLLASIFLGKHFGFAGDGIKET